MERIWCDEVFRPDRSMALAYITRHANELKLAGARVINMQIVEHTSGWTAYAWYESEEEILIEEQN